MGETMWHHNHRDRKSFFFKGFIFVIVLIALVSLILLLLWNWLMPAIFGLTEIDYWQAVGLLLLSKILFSGFHKKSRAPHMPKQYWRKRFEENDINADKNLNNENI